MLKAFASWLRGPRSSKEQRSTSRALKRFSLLALELLEDRLTPAISISGLDTALGQVTFTGDLDADALILSRSETSPGSGTFVLGHNISGGGLNSFIDLNSSVAGDQTMTLQSGTARSISINLGAGNNTLTLDDSWTFNHKVTFDGTAGTDVLVGNNAGNTWQITDLTTKTGNLTPGSDNVTFVEVETLTGGVGASDDTLQGENLARTWNLNAVQTYTDGTTTMNFSDMEVLQGGSAVDTFNIRADTFVTSLNSGGGDDVFAFHLNAGVPVVLSGNIDGGIGSDTLTYANYAAAADVIASLTGLGASDGFSGTEISIAGVFTNINVMVGSTDSDDSLQGRDAAATFEIDGTNRYIDAVSSVALSFSGMEHLAGGSGVDTFAVSVNHTGNLGGGVGADVFNFSAGTLTGDASGDAGADDFNFTGGAIAGIVDGDAGNDSFDVTANTTVTGGILGGDDDDAVSVSLTAVLTASVSGNAGNDSVTLSDTASIIGGVAGNAGTDTLSFVGYASARSITLTALGTTDGFNGSEASISAGFTDIDVLTGSSNTDTLIGLDAAATWEVDGSNRYVSTASLAFSAIENLTGGSAVDTFDVTVAHTGTLTGNAGADDFNVSAALTGSIIGDAGNDTFDLSGTGSVSGNVAGGADDDALNLAGSSSVAGTYAGGVGSDTLSFAGYTSAASMTLTSLGVTDGFDGTGPAIAGFTDIDVLTGSSNTDTLIGLDAAATWEVDGSNRYVSTASLAFSAIENLTGGSAVDTFDVTAAHTGTLTGNAGADDFNVSLTAVLTGDISGGVGNDTVDLSNSANVTGAIDGGADNDTVTLANTATITGSVIGGAGIDGLSYAGYGSAVSVILSGAVADGYRGGASAISGGFGTIDIVTGSGNTDTLTGEQVSSTWTLDSSNSYNDGAVNSLTFASFEGLIGGAAADTFKVMNNSAFSGTINGGVGANTVDYSDASNTTAISMIISAANAGSVAGAFSFSAIGTLKGGAGNDTFTFSAAAARVTGTINGGGGTNALVYSGYTTSVRVNLAANSASGTAGASNIHNVTGGSGNDILQGSNSANVLTGEGGNDILVGGGGDDNLVGGAGNDILLGGLGADILDGGANDDILIGGVTTYDANLSALNAIMAEWGRTTVPYATRVARIFGSGSGGLNGSYRFNDATVNDDAGAIDSLTGGAGLDWIFSTGGDSVVDLHTGGTETLTLVS